MPDPILTRALAAGLDLEGTGTRRERAVRVHDFLRDHLRFGLTPWFDAADPATTLRLRVGHCNPQGALFTRLLRALDVPARLHFVTISNDVLRGLWPAPPELSHAFSEVRLDGRWQRVDSYIVDPELRRGAARRLAERGWELGYGMHARGTDRWDGRGDAFSQLADDAMALEDHGSVLELGSFFGHPEYRHRAAGLALHQWLRPLRLAAGPVLDAVNANVEATRRHGAEAGAVSQAAAAAGRS